MEIPFVRSDIPSLDTDQMMEVDRIMVEENKIELIQMMENAGRNLAHLSRIRFLNHNPAGKKVIILAGSGGNGGGALVCARRLHNWGSQVLVITSHPEDDFKAVPAHQLDILRRMHVTIIPAGSSNRAPTPDLIIDGLIGYSLRGAPDGTTAGLIRWANQQNAPILALDVPSGLDAANGTIHDPVIRATATMTLALPKAGLQGERVESVVGELYLADISIPPEVYTRIDPGLQVGPIFAAGEILRIR